MLWLSIMHHYLLWHYSRAFYEIFHVWLNLLWFVVHFFSIPQLLKSWVAPWKRMTEGRGEKWDLEDLAGYIIIGLLSRIIGFIVRTLVILAGLISLFCMVIGGFVFYTFWVAAPILTLVTFGLGLVFLFS